VKRYVAEKVRHIRDRTHDDEHVLIVPGERDEMVGGERARTYFIASPPVSKTSGYRVLLRLEAIERILEKERPGLVESGDPYQCGWRAVRAGAAMGIPVVGFYHSHFPEAYIRMVRKFFGRVMTEFCMGLARRYVCNLYNRFERTIVPSPALAALLREWGVRNVTLSNLGVDASVFQPSTAAGEDVRGDFGIPVDRTLLLYVGRLALEKNTRTLFESFRILARENPDRFHLLIVGDGLQRAELQSLVTAHPARVTHIPYSSDARRLATFYRTADLFVHPGVQETFGLVTLEAQACGTPVVGIRGSYMDRVVRCGQEMWARENSASALARAILEMSGEKTRGNPHRLHAEIAAQFSWDGVFARLFDLYREVIDNYRRP
jgi:alpha-1,6-mannosyltransferase